MGIEGVGRGNTFVAKPLQHHGFIEVFSKTENGIFQKCAPLYEKGHSLKQIVRLTGYPYLSLRDALIEGGVKMRDCSNSADYDFKKAKKSGSVTNNPPYGFVYFQGKLTPNPQEYEIGLLIKSWYEKGKNPNRIATMLNERRLRTRNNKAWYRNVVLNITNSKQIQLESKNKILNL